MIPVINCHQATHEGMETFFSIAIFSRGTLEYLGQVSNAESLTHDTLREVPCDFRFCLSGYHMHVWICDLKRNLAESGTTFSKVKNKLGDLHFFIIEL